MPPMWGTYVTVDDVRRMILKGESIRVLDSRDASDITRSFLLQILAEQEAEGHEPVLTNRAIEQIIRFYGNNAGNIVSRYIEQSIGRKDHVRRTMPTRGQPRVSQAATGRSKP